MGSINAWFPSLRSTLHHVGLCKMELFGQDLSAKSIGLNALYFDTDVLIILVNEISSKGYHISDSVIMFRVAKQIEISPAILV